MTVKLAATETHCNSYATEFTQATNVIDGVSMHRHMPITPNCKDCAIILITKHAMYSNLSGTNVPIT